MPLPIVLAHGLLGALIGLGERSLGPARWGLKWGYFHRVDRALAARGHRVITPLVHPTGSIAVRAAHLKRAVVRELEVPARTASRENGLEGRCIVIGHSMGGLDARFMVSRLGMADRVAAVLTIATPHRGSPFADWLVRRARPLAPLYRRVGRFALDVGAGVDLTCEAMRRFNEEVPDAPGVAYFSVGCARRHVNPLLLPSQQIILAAEGPNDGLVSVRSSEWGRPLMTWRVDHFQSISRRLPRVPGLERLIGEPRVDVASLYVEAVEQVVEALGRSAQTA